MVQLAVKIGRDLSVNSQVYAQNIKHAMQIHEDLFVLAKIHEDLFVLAKIHEDISVLAKIHEVLSVLAKKNMKICLF